jgi:hypothetical protein
MAHLEPYGSPMVNQLKFNLGSVLDNINMVNIVHRPQPLIIENNVNHRRVAAERDLHRLGTSNSFQYIDEQKLNMYTYLIRRDMQAKNTIGKYEPALIENLNDSLLGKDKIRKYTADKSVGLTKNVSDASMATAIKNESNWNEKEKSRVGPGLSKKPMSPTNNFDDVKRVCEDAINAIEQLKQQFIECKLLSLFF